MLDTVGCGCERGKRMKHQLARPALLISLTALLAAPAAAQPGPPAYAWSGPVERAARLEQRVPPPAGFSRVPVTAGSFAEWLRGLPLKPEGSPVKLYTGAPKWRQDVHVAVIDIDVGKRDLQQCADAIMRLRAEWLYGQRRANEIAFNYTNGGRVSFARWARGERPSSDGRSWSPRAKADASHDALRSYLDQVFAYAGTYSLERELKPVDLADIAIGDVFIRGGFPGHAVLVADMASNPATGEKRFILVQSFMPAQDIHVLRNPADPAGGPWYPVEFAGDLVTPEWQFARNSLRRWP
jgi:hypothetical protein